MNKRISLVAATLALVLLTPAHAAPITAEEREPMAKTFGECVSGMSFVQALAGDKFSAEQKAKLEKLSKVYIVIMMTLVGEDKAKEIAMQLVETDGKAMQDSVKDDHPERFVTMAMERQRACSQLLEQRMVDLSAEVQAAAAKNQAAPTAAQ